MGPRTSAKADENESFEMALDEIVWLITLLATNLYDP